MHFKMICLGLWLQRSCKSTQHYLGAAVLSTMMSTKLGTPQVIQNLIPRRMLRRSFLQAKQISEKYDIKNEKTSRGSSKWSKTAAK